MEIVQDFINNLWVAGNLNMGNSNPHPVEQLWEARILMVLASAIVTSLERRLFICRGMSVHRALIIN